MKLVKTASGKKAIKISKSEWESYGRKAGWTKMSGVGPDPVFDEVEKWIMTTGKPGVIGDWWKHKELAYRAYKGDKQAWNELLMKCGDQAMGMDGGPAGNAPSPSGTRPGTQNPYANSKKRMSKKALGEAGEAYVDPQGMPTTPDAGQEIADVQLSEKAIWEILQKNFGYKVTQIPNGYVLTK